MQQLLDRTVGVSLRALFPDCQILGGDDIRFTSCCGDWRRCRPGDLFVAVPEAGRDGHEDAGDAVRLGASAVLCERLVSVGVPTCLVEDSREAFGRVCQALAGDPGASMRTIGVAGTRGKTIANLLISSALRQAGHNPAWMSTIEYSDSYEQVAADRSTPTAPELAAWLGRSASNGCSDAVIEISSQALAERRVAGLRLDGAVLTNLRSDHLDFHGSVENYRRATLRLFDMLKPGGFAVVNADDPVASRVGAALDCPVLTFGMHSSAELTAVVVERHKSEQTFLLSAGCDTVPVRTRIIGDQHIYNCLAASAACLALGVDLMSVVRGLEMLDRIPGRLERIECGQPFGVYVDAADTPDTLSAALKSVRQVTRGRVICVYSADGERSRQQRPLLGRVAERSADISIITGGKSGGEDALQIVHDVLDGYDRPARGQISPDRLRAIHWALAQAAPSDCVLIAGQGCRDWQAASADGLACDDRTAAVAWLRGATIPCVPRLRIAPGT